MAEAILRRCVRAVASFSLYLYVSVDMQQLYLTAWFVTRENLLPLQGKRPFPSALKDGAPRPRLWWWLRGISKNYRTLRSSEVSNWCPSFVREPLPHTPKQPP